MKLPQLFEEQMAGLLGNEYPAFRNSMDQRPFYGLRINTLKISVEAFLAISPFELRPIPWVPEGFYYEEAQRPAKHPYYHAGLYYIQEPSAMSPVPLLDPKPGEVVLDTCAAPGGKSCQIAARLGGRGTLVTNDVSASRAKALLRNVEISGIRNAVILCEEPSRLVARFKEGFDRILVDAPCSGEGMFRKQDGGGKDWHPDRQEEYRAMQDPILEAAAALLKPGGQLVYSTCTFNTLENEAVIYSFLRRHPEFFQCPGEVPGVSIGFDSAEGSAARAMYRLWPHREEGEGHFLARVEKAGEKPEAIRSGVPLSAGPDPFRLFAEQYLPGWPELERYRMAGERLLLVPDHGFDLSGLRVSREGWHLGDVRKGRFEPSQALAMGLQASEFSQTMDFDPEDPDLIRYIKGETLHLEGPKGWILITVSGFPLGWAKGVDGFFKNHYPAGWRRLD